MPVPVQRPAKKKKKKKVKKMVNGAQPMEDAKLADQEADLLDQINALDNRPVEPNYNVPAFDENDFDFSGA